MSPMLDRPFMRSVVASAFGAALFVPVDSAPWWMPLLRDLPFGGWLWPLAGGAVTWLVYRIGVRAGTTGVVAAESPTELEGLRSGDQYRTAESEESTALPSVVDPELEGPSGESANALLDPLVQAALSLKGATPAEVERRKGRSAGQDVTVSGVVESVYDWSERVCVCLTLDHGRGDDFVLCLLDFQPSLAPALNAIAKGARLRAGGTVLGVGPRKISLGNCVLLRIGEPVGEPVTS